MDEVKPVACVPTVEHREPCESRGSRTVLGAPGGEIPPGNSTNPVIAVMSATRPLFLRMCSLIPGLGVKLSAIILAGPTVLSAVGACPPHDGVRRRWWINVESAVALSSARQASSDLTSATVPAGTSFPAVLREPLDLLIARYAATSFFDHSMRSKN